MISISLHNQPAALESLLPWALHVIIPTVIDVPHYTARFAIMLD
jgi:hypothetical protein